MQTLNDVKEVILSAGTRIELGQHKVSAPEFGISRSDGVKYTPVAILEEDYPLSLCIMQCREWVTGDANRRRCSVAKKNETPEEFQERKALALAQIAETAKEQEESGFVEIFVRPKTKRTRSERKVTLATVQSFVTLNKASMTPEQKAALIAELSA